MLPTLIGNSGNRETTSTPKEKNIRCYTEEYIGMLADRSRSALDTMRSDVNQKITKLEADTHNLCLNLINLQKNRGKLTNGTVALTRDPEDPTTGSNHTEEAINFKPDCIRVLLDPKHVQNDCCTICTCSECEETREGLEDIELKDIEEALRKTISAEEIERPNCCCMCSANSTASPQFIRKDAVGIASQDVIDANFNENRGKWNFCSNCSIDGRCCVDCCDISECPINNYKGFDECIRTVPDIKRRCRGGMDRIGSKIRSAGSSHGEAKTRWKKNVCEGCECDLCDVRNFEGEPPPCVTTCGKSSERLCDCDDENVNDGLVISSGDAPAKLRQICKVEKLREVLEQLKNRNHALRKMLNDCECLSKSDVNSLAPEKSKSAVKKINEKSSGVRNSIAESTSGLITTVKVLQNKCRTKDGMILTLAEAVKKIATPEQTERILEKLKNPCTDDSPIRDLDRSELWNYLHTENSPKHERRHDRVSVEDKTSKKNIFICIFVFLIVISSQTVRRYGYFASSTMFNYFGRLFASLERMYDPLSVELTKFVSGSAALIKNFGEEFSAEAIRNVSRAFICLGEYLNFFSSHLTFVGALFGSLSFAKTVWSLGKNFLTWNEKFSDDNFSSWFEKFVESLKLSKLRLTCYAKSQYHVFYYLACLALGFMASKMSRIGDKWPTIFSSFYENNLSIDRSIW